ncbi:hypothetical protein J6590_041859 [Homalodisca vitripennis]|nr:hypothetical protein J6590_041859 [Homalodisca vitripennis]
MIGKVAGGRGRDIKWRSEQSTLEPGRRPWACAALRSLVNGRRVQQQCRVAQHSESEMQQLHYGEEVCVRVRGGLVRTVQRKWPLERSSRVLYAPHRAIIVSSSKFGARKIHMFQRTISSIPTQSNFDHIPVSI